MKTSKSTPKAKAAAKPRTRREAAGTDAPATTAKPVKARKRQGNVRSLILELLAGGPMPTTELVAKGKFSAAAAFMHLKTLREDGAITGTRLGREVLYSLTGNALASAGIDAEAATPSTKRGRPTKAKSGKAPINAGNRGDSLQAALKDLTHRLSPINDLKEKVSVLNQLAGSLPGSVAKVLTAIRDDLQRLG